MKINRLTCPFWVILIVFACTATAKESPTYSPTFSLSKLIQYALENSPKMKTSSILIKNSEMEIENTQANFLPSLNLSTTHGLKDNLSDHREDKNLWYSSFLVDLSETFYDNGVNWINYKINKIKRQKADIIYQQEREKIALELGLAYIQHSYLSKMLTIEEEQLGLLKKQNDIFSKFYFQGLKTKRDYLRMKTEVNRAEIGIAAAKNSLIIAKMDIYKILSIPYDQNNKPLENIEIFVDNPTVDKLSTNTATTSIPANINSFNLSENLDYKIGITDEAVTALEVELIDKKVGPELTLSSGINYSAANYISGEYSWDERDSVSWEILFTIKYNLWDWGSRKRDKQMAANRKIIEKIEFEKKINDLRSDLSKMSIEIQEKIENCKNSEELYKLEEDNYQLIYSDYRNGKVAYLDLITSLKAKAEAKAKYYSAFFDLKKSIFNFYYQQGSLYEHICKEDKL